jgi:hypothetical protein
MKKGLAILLYLLPLVAFAKNPTVSGYVTDAKTGERLIGATVVDLLSGAGTVTNVHGFYSLSLPYGEIRLQAGYVGYEHSTVPPFVLQKDTLVELQITSSNMLGEVVVEGQQSISGVHSVQMSAVEVPVTQIKAIPAIGGEVDVLKAIQLLPGVQSGSEGSAGMYVRGGGPDENLIMLDGVPLYSVNHMLGFFSVFNADAVKNVTLYEGNFPARYGGRLSSIIDVRQKDGDAYGYHGNLTVGLVSTKLSAEGPIYWKKEDYRKYRNHETVKGQTTFNISARRTLYDLFMAPIAAIVTSRETDGEEVTTGGYYFYDVNAKLTHTFSENDKLSGSFYIGDDVIYARLRERGDKESDNSYMRMRYNWGNLFAAVNYEHRFSGRLYNTSQVSYTRYKYKLGVGSVRNDKKSHERNEIGLEYDSYIMDLMAQTNFEWRPNTRHEVHFGGSYTYHIFRPQVGRVDAISLSDSTESKIDTTFSVGGTNHTHEASLYIEDTYTPCRWFKMNIGLHAGLYHTDNTTYPSIEPRVGFRFLPYKDLAIKLSYAYMSQYVHMLSNSSVSLPTDLWVPVTAKIPPMRSMQVAAGITYNILDQVELSVEGYYKRMINLLEYKDGASYMSGKNWQEQVAVGNGWSYGVQFLAQRKMGPVTGWIGYTWSRTMRQFDQEGQMINFGRPFHAKYDREHDLSITLQYQINKKWDIAATFVYGTGTRGTIGLQKYDDWLYNNMFTSRTSTSTVNFISERNNYKMPDYHRLDLGATCHLPDKKHKDWEHILNMSVYNVYCNFNPFLVYPSGNKLYKLSLFPILPSLSYTFKF